ncbi:hypothetical protein TNCV_4807471 [Trichonephila clavipes]|nr:hypothetical protein TNCV_4807471 [Trichonephila clavipes]
MSEIGSVNPSGEYSPLSEIRRPEELYVASRCHPLKGNKVHYTREKMNIGLQDLIPISHSCHKASIKDMSTSSAPTHIDAYVFDTQDARAVGSLVVRALDSKPEGLDSILRVHTEYELAISVGPKVLWVVTAETTGAEDWRIFPSPPVPCLNCGGVNMWCHHLSWRSPNCLRL